MSTHEHQPTPVPVALAHHDPRWESAARDEGERIANVLRELVVAVHHFGSTAIPGIAAKPVLDLLPIVRRLEELDARRAEVESLGYEWWGEFGMPGRRLCTWTDPRTGARSVHAHFWIESHEEIDRHIAFRDYCRAHPNVAREYEAMKLRCRELHASNSFAYSECKGPWIQPIEEAALRWWRASRSSAPASGVARASESRGAEGRTSAGHAESLPTHIRAACEAIVGSIVEVSRFHVGQHDTYLVHGASVRVVAKRIGPGSLQWTSTPWTTEAAALRAFAGRLPTPTLHAAAQDPAGDFVVLSYLPSRSLRDVLLLEPPSVAAIALEGAARQLRQLHAIADTVDVAPFPLDPILASWRRDPTLGELAATVRSAAHLFDSTLLDDALAILWRSTESLTRLWEPVGLIHGDYQPRNILCELDRSSAIAGVVDWEMARVASRATDLGQIVRFAADDATEAAVLTAYAGSNHDIDVVALRTYDLLKILCGISRAPDASGDTALWIEYVRGCVDHIDRGDRTRARHAARNLLALE